MIIVLIKVLNIQNSVLTVEPDGAVRFPSGILGHTLVGAVVLLLYVVDGEPHVRFVTRRPRARLRLQINRWVRQKTM